MSNRFISFNQTSKFERMSSSFSSSSLCFVAFLLSSFIIDGGLAAPKKHVGGNSFNENRIQGGGDTSQDVFKFIPALFIVVHFGPKMISAPCTSTIISPRHLLTAAHCVVVDDIIKGSIPHRQITRLNWIMSDLRPKEIDQRPEVNGKEVVYAQISKFCIPSKIFFHPSYRHDVSGVLYNDLAILEYPEGVNFSIDPITLAHGFQEKDGDHALAAGYGYYKRKVVGDKIEYELPNVLQNATIALWKERCHVGENQYMSMIPFEAFICTGTEERISDHGDSGGPLMVERNGTLHQVGVLSAGTNYSAFYTRLTPAYCDWITKVTDQEVHCKSLPPPDPAKSTQAPSPSSSPGSKKTPTAVPQKSVTTTTSASNMVKFNAGLIILSFIVFAFL